MSRFFNSYRKPTGTSYTLTVASLALGIVFSPAALAIRTPASYLATLAAFATTTLCLFVARVSWAKYSDLTIATFETRFALPR